MEEAFKQIVDAVGEVQAQAFGNATMLEAMLMAHPDPEKLRRCWHALSAPRIADTAMNAATKNREVDERFAWHLAAWSKKLEAHHPAAGQRAP